MFVHYILFLTGRTFITAVYIISRSDFIQYEYSVNKKKVILNLTKKGHFKSRKSVFQCRRKKMSF